MNNKTAEKVKTTKIRLFLVIISLVLSLAAYLVCQFAIGKEKLGFSPVFMLFIVFFMLDGAEYLVFSAVKKSTFAFAMGGLSLIAGTLILLLCLKVVWYAVLISAIVLCAVVFFSVFLFRTPELTQEFDNGDGSERADYEVRKAEKQAQKQAELLREQDDLPEIKSFKD